METNPLERLYGVFTKSQTYLNLVYLLLAFPLGLAYFIFLVTGFSLGLGLLIVWVGFLILAGVLALSWVLVLFERQLAVTLLQVEIPPMLSQATPGGTLLQQVKSYLTNPVTWKGIMYLFLKFPIGIASFVITITSLSLSFGLLFAPLTYPWWHINFGYWRIDSLPAAMIAFVAGLVIAPLSLHVMNLLAGWIGQLTRWMLSPSRMPDQTPQVPSANPPVAPVQMTTHENI